jgi:Cu-Zn family superoxide dismutase
MNKITMSLIIAAVFSFLGNGLLVADESGEMPAGEDPVAVVEIKATAEGSPVEGKVMFYAMQGGLMASGSFSGLAGPGKRAIHVHENGSCDDKGNAAGSHFNPYGAQHGLIEENGIHGAHIGDMGNVVVDENGNGKLTVHLPGAHLEGGDGIMGKAVILHEKEDDFSQPTGNAGGRVGCGIIVAADVSGEEEATQ